MKPLTKSQKKLLVMLARRGWQKLHAAGAIDEDFNTWRRREAVAACGRSISEAGRGDFDALYAHFLALAGETEGAFKAASNPLPNGLRNVLHVMGVEMKKAGVGAAYVAGICRRMFGRDEPASEAEAKAVLVAVIKHGKKARA